MNWVKRLAGLILLAAIAVVLALSHKINRENQGKVVVESVVLYRDASSLENYLPSLERTQELFPKADFRILRDSFCVEIFDKEKQLLGRLLFTHKIGSEILGYGGPTPLYIWMDTEDRILKIDFLGQDESARFVQKVMDARYLEAWEGARMEYIPQLKIDAVTGASYTSWAISDNIRLASELYTSHHAEKKWTLHNHWTNILLMAYILLALVFFFGDKKLGKYRWILLLLSVGGVGLWAGEMLSMERYRVWLYNGLQGGSLALILVFLLSVLIPVFTNRTFYCYYYCPLGAAQELMGKIINKPRRYPQWLTTVFTYLPPTLFLFMVCSWLLEWNINFSNYEPFVVFQWRVVSWGMLLVVGLILVLSLFYSRPWCKCCPCGWAFELIRQGSRHKSFTYLLLCITGIVVVLLFWKWCIMLL